MNKIIALFCAAVIAVSSSAAIVMADDANVSDEASVEEVVDAPANDTGEEAKGNDDVNNEDTEQTNDADTENTEQTVEEENNADPNEDTEADNLTPEVSENQEATEDAEAKKATETSEASESTATTEVSEASTASSSGDDTATATNDPSAIPETAEKPEENETEIVTVMKRPFTLVKSFGDNPFDDCQSGWFKNYVSFAYANGIIKGYSNNTFDPYGKITGAQLAVMLYRVTTGKSDIVTEGDKWSEEAMAWAMENDIMSDFAGDNFNGEADLIREDIICMMYRAYTLYNEAEAAGEIDVERFPDAGDVSDYAETAMRWAVASKIITGKSDKWIDPLSNVTRAETATIFERYLENLEFADVPVQMKVTTVKSAETDTTASDTAETAEPEAATATDVEEIAEPEAAAEPEAPAEPASAE